MSKGFHRLPSAMPWSNSMQALGYAKIAEVETDITVKDGETFTIDVPAITPGTFDLGPPKMTATQAKATGFTGDQCSHCGSMRMRISGHCQCCDDCGTTTGCS